MRSRISRSTRSRIRRSRRIRWSRRSRRGKRSRIRSSSRSRRSMRSRSVATGRSRREMGVFKLLNIKRIFKQWKSYALKYKVFSFCRMLKQIICDYFL